MGRRGGGQGAHMAMTLGGVRCARGEPVYILSLPGVETPKCLGPFCLLVITGS